jgi:hypothetical protein
MAVSITGLDLGSESISVQGLFHSRGADQPGTEIDSEPLLLANSQPGNGESGRRACSVPPLTRLLRVRRFARALGRRRPLDGASRRAQTRRLLAASYGDFSVKPGNTPRSRPRGAVGRSADIR